MDQNNESWGSGLFDFLGDIFNSPSVQQIIYDEFGNPKPVPGTGYPSTTFNPSMIMWLIGGVLVLKIFKII